MNYTLATELNKKSEAIQVVTLLTVIGEESHEIFANWDSPGDNAKISPVLVKFEWFCQLQKNVLFEQYRFNRRIQEPGETFDQYHTTLRKLAGCGFKTITLEEILRDRLMYGNRDAKVRERLLHSHLQRQTKYATLQKALWSKRESLKMV